MYFTKFTMVINYNRFKIRTSNTFGKSPVLGRTKENPIPSSSLDHLPPRRSRRTASRDLLDTHRLNFQLTVVPCKRDMPLLFPHPCEPSRLDDCSGVSKEFYVPLAVRFGFGKGT